MKSRKPKLPRVRVKVPTTRSIPNKKKAPQKLEYDPYHDDGDIGAEDALRRQREGYHYEDY